MNRTAKRLALIVAGVVVQPGVALADTVNCPSSGNCYGSPGDDVIYGTDNINYIFAQGGSDRPIYGYSEHDEIHGAYGYDTMWGQGWGDYIVGGENGTTSWDRLIGGTGADNLNDQYNPPEQDKAEFDAACGGGDNDFIDIKEDDGGGNFVVADQFNGGGGSDTVTKDPWDNFVEESTCIG